MKPPRLISVSGSAFGSLVEPFEFQFPQTGMLLLRGENLDTQGGSASGKSTFIHALNYPHGTCPVPLTELQSWYTKDAPQVTNTYDVDGKIVQISKGKRFELVIDGEAVRGGADIKKEKIDLLFGTSAEMRGALTYRGQGKPGLFLSKTDKEMKEFLTTLLNLDQWDEESKAALALAKDLETKYNVLVSRRKDVLARLATLRAAGTGVEEEESLADVVKQIEGHEALQRKYESTIQKMEKDAETVYAFTKNVLAPALAELTEKITALEARRISAPPMSDEWERLRTLKDAVQTRVARLESEDLQLAKDHLVIVEALRTQIQSMLLQLQGGNKLRADADRVLAQIDQLEKNVCPTCQREWDDVQAKLEDLKIELEQINGETEELKYVQEELDRVKAEFQELPRTLEPNPKIAQMRAALEKCRADMAVEEHNTTAETTRETERVAKELKTLRDHRESLTNDSYNSAAKERDKVLAGIGNLKALAIAERDKKVRAELTRQKLAEEVGACRERRRQISEAEAKEAELYEEAQPVQVEMARWADYGHLTGREAFRGKFFDEVLDAISAESNSILASIANTRNVTIEFSTGEETADGKVRQEIVPVITINGHKNGRPSGGMKSAIELAVDLAVGRIISERTGVCPGWLILDESFDGLGAREKETCLEILQTYAHDRLVIVVDHASETQGLFTQKITIRSSGGYSIIA